MIAVGFVSWIGSVQFAVLPVAGSMLVLITGTVEAMGSIELIGSFIEGIPRIGLAVGLSVIKEERGFGVIKEEREFVLFSVEFVVRENPGIVIPPWNKVLPDL